MQLTFSLITEQYWERRQEFAALDPAMQVPVLVEDNRTTIPNHYAISQYLEDKYPDPELSLFGKTPEEGAGIRRLVSWFDDKFFHEVTRYILNEKVIRYYTGVGQPFSDALRAAKVNMVSHMEYISFLRQDSKWLMGNQLTLADISAAAQLSVLDYLNEINWDIYPETKEWYSLIKSRPSFRSLLNDRVSGFMPPKCYANLDF